MREMKCIRLLPVLLSAVCLQAQAPALSWQKALGGFDDDKALTICNGTNGGYVVAGFTKSSSGDITHSYDDPNIAESSDIWVVKLDDFGQLQWQKNLGGSIGETTYSIIPNTDGGYLIAGWTNSSDHLITHLNSQYNDAWLVKLDQNGTMLWQKTYGGTGIDNSLCAQQTPDGGFIVCGSSSSNDVDVSGNHGGFDLWIFKTDASGNLQWQKSLGGSGMDIGLALTLTPDGGYAVCGYTNSNDGDVSGQHGMEDAWIVKLDSSGAIQWQRSMGGSRYDQAHDIQATPDGGLVVCGFTGSDDGDLQGSHLSTDYWILKFDADGALQWQKTYGGSAYDTAQDIRVTQDGGFIINGSTKSNDGDVVGFHGGDGFDFWAVRLDTSGTLLWQRPLGGSGLDLGFGVLQAPDGGFVFSGGSTSWNGDVSGVHQWFQTQDYWIVKLEPELGTGQFGSNSFSIYPNPARDVIKWELPSENVVSVRVSDASGKIVMTPGGVSQIDVSALASGIYLLQAKTERDVFQSKFIKL